jgi:GrpB-like predicted nucleotidyltransferase (UPF0157 family)
MNNTFVTKPHADSLNAVADIEQLQHNESEAVSHVVLSATQPKKLDPVVIEEYTPTWMDMFNLAKHQLESIIPSALVDKTVSNYVLHIGSTSVPGMHSKPVIDMQLLVISTDPFLEGNEGCALLQQLGYEYRGEAGIYDRQYYRAGNPVTHHLHVQRKDSRQTRRQLLMRAYLRNNADSAQRYSEFKRLIAPIFRDNRIQYANCKNPYVDAIIAKAEEWLCDILSNASLTEHFDLFTGEMIPNRCTLLGTGLPLNNNQPKGTTTAADNTEKENIRLIDGLADLITNELVLLTTRVEPNVSELLTTAIGVLSSWSFFKFEHRVKSEISIKRKIMGDQARIVCYANAAKLSRHIVVSGQLNGCPLLFDMRPQLFDTLRYSFIIEDENKYTENVEAMLRYLQFQGIVVVQIFNFWPLSKLQQDHRIAHVGVHVYLRYPKENVTFELQFHTAFATHVNSTLVHPIYQRYRVEEDGSKREQLRIEMCQCSETIPVPPHVQRIGHLSDFPPTHNYLVQTATPTTATDNNNSVQEFDSTSISRTSSLFEATLQLHL